MEGIHGSYLFLPFLCATLRIFRSEKNILWTKVTNFIMTFPLYVAFCQTTIFWKRIKIEKIFLIQFKDCSVIDIYQPYMHYTVCLFANSIPIEEFQWHSVNGFSRYCNGSCNLWIKCLFRLKYIAHEQKPIYPLCKLFKGKIYNFFSVILFYPFACFVINWTTYRFAISWSLICCHAKWMDRRFDLNPKVNQLNLLLIISHFSSSHPISSLSFNLKAKIRKRNCIMTEMLLVSKLSSSSLRYHPNQNNKMSCICWDIGNNRRSSPQ